MQLKNKVIKLLKGAKEASFCLAKVSAKEKDAALSKMASALLKNTKYLLSENSKDVALANEIGLSESLVDRLTLTERRVKEMADSLKQVVSLKDPAGKMLRQWKRPNGLIIKKISVPIGVIGIIYESRPNVTSDCAGLCLKSGNACVLRGGSEAINSNRAIHGVITKGLREFNIPESAITMIDTADRKAVEILLKQDSLVDVVIPRGGEGLIRYVAENSSIPVIKHYKGVCHLYIDKDADFKMAMDIMLNAKVQRPGVCNAIEKMLVHKDIARKFLPQAAGVLDDKGVELRGCSWTLKILKGIKKAVEKDWYEEYLDLILAIKVVKSVDEAISHINKYGSRHSDAIVTKNKLAADKFLKEVDSACVYHNASTRFTDGYQFGMGAEIGISTDKIHCRGPMALEELCIYKYVIFGSGQTRA
ncbi:MAG: glutamate-5-semialdehyde dehydrogenase [Candidatus Omnitrophica bacterium CG02_land_8_20_14_3_00__42_8]|nr:MAG: glutamate-5-semialdehyde dehydrogenase [Candidatus Omnitrophica bacterium CG02_land_8_20_14_3_00__42_8]PIW67350.1 MAG: glutamate-5-semialdehyde dehydrogenase [Candidatus Omnitrophica bacterium CG12_big_fil_rev_8_21_14_0_65_42_8]